jgi:hypothetical protein
MTLRLRLLSLVALLPAACAAPGQHPQIVSSQKSAVELRSMQARTFDTTDRNRVLRAVIATLQDYGYGLDRVSSEAGTVTATKVTQLRLTASVYPRGETQTVVRTNAFVLMPGRNTQVDDPVFYRDLVFEPLGRNLFLTAMAAPDREEDAPTPQVPAEQEQPGQSPSPATGAARPDVAHARYTAPTATP